MPVQTLEFAEPFFTVRILKQLESYQVEGRVILLNLAETPVRILDQTLASLQSVIVANAEIVPLQPQEEAA